MTASVGLATVVATFPAHFELGKNGTTWGLAFLTLLTGGAVVATVLEILQAGREAGRKSYQLCCKRLLDQFISGAPSVPPVAALKGTPTTAAVEKAREELVRGIMKKLPPR